MELRPYQKKAVRVSKNMWGLWFRMRVGKTPTAITRATARITNALIICPKQLTEQWKREILIWNDKKEFDFEVISRETFRRDWKKILPREAIIIDECHRGFGNYKTQLYKAGENYIKKHNVKYLWLLSGTPFTSSSWSIYSYGRLMSRNWNWFDWKTAFFYNIKMGHRMISMPKVGMDSRLQEILRSIGTVIDLKDVADIPDDEDIMEYFNLNTLQKGRINGLLDVLPIVIYTHIHELESGVLKSDGYSEELKISCEKDTRIKELVEDNEKIIIVSRYLAQIDKYEELLKNCEKKIFIIRGRTKMPS